ncbi:MAG: DUF4333 domain-containing protein [Elainellaceae cyanobacterium]
MRIRAVENLCRKRDVGLFPRLALIMNGVMGRAHQPKSRIPPSRRSGGILILGLGMGLIAGCSSRLDTEAIATGIQDDLEQQSRLSIQTIRCPRRIKPEAGGSFQCIGMLESSSQFLIRVKQQNDQGSVEWDIPNSKNLLNLAELERHFQTNIATETGIQPIIDCGETFRLNRPGDQFNCQVLNSVLIEQSQLEAIQVNIDSQGNVNWQQILQEVEENEIAQLLDEEAEPESGS